MPHVPVGQAPGEPVAVRLAFPRTAHDGSQVLALCVNAPAQQPPGDVERVPPFLNTHNYACSLSSEIVRSVIFDRWESLDLPRSFVVEVPVELDDPEEPAKAGFRGRARMRLTIHPTRPGVSLVASSPPLQDALRLVCDEEIELLELWDADGTKVKDLDQIGTGARGAVSWRLQLFETRPDDVSPGERVLADVAAQLLDSLYAPMIEPTRLTRIEGVTLSARGIVFLRGDLS
jgi:hypothetical protein